tara:strand:- start:82 stop:432 length:351 start_codon:yes stop_codon:yes gene_type:complete
MASYKTKLNLYLKANSKIFDREKVSLQDNSDGNGVFIASWNYDGLAKPSDSQIASYETAGNTEETARAVLNKRASEYKELKEQLDLLYHDMVADKGDKTGEWFKHIKAVKDANPKE